jgi:hypothetical protein
MDFLLLPVEYFNNMLLYVVIIYIEHF